MTFPKSPNVPFVQSVIFVMSHVGYPYKDDVVLNPDSAKALGLKLIEYADEWIEEKRD